MFDRIESKQLSERFTILVYSYMERLDSWSNDYRCTREALGALKTPMS